MVIFEKHEKIGSFGIIFPDEFHEETDINSAIVIPICVPQDLKTILYPEMILLSPTPLIPVYDLELHNVIQKYMAFHEFWSTKWQTVVAKSTQDETNRVYIMFYIGEIKEEEPDKIVQLGDILFYYIQAMKASLN